MTKKARVTLRDIARYANVSVSTVSRALNNHPYVDETTRQIIYEVAGSLDYPLEKLRASPLDSARSVTLVSAKRNEKSLSGNDFEYLATEGIRAELDARNIQVVVRRLWSDGRNLPEIWTDTGIIWMGGVVDRAFVTEAQQRNIPCILLGGHALPLHAHCLMADYAHGMANVMDHLIAQGRRSIGFINGPASTLTSTEKFNGFLASLHRHGLPLRPEQVVQAVDGWFDVETGYRTTRTLIEQFPEADAIIYFDDNSAMGGLTALKETGRRIPDDIAITGIHNYEISRFTDPPLTTVSFDMYAMGRMAAQWVCALMDQPANDSYWIMLAPTELIIRASA